MKPFVLPPGSRRLARSLSRTVWLTAALLATLAAHAQVAPHSPRLENLDRRVVDSRQMVLPSRNQSQALQELQARLPGVRVDLDSVVGAPKTVMPRLGLLTGPDGAGLAVDSAIASAFPAADKDRAIKAFLNQYRDLFGHGAEALAGTRVTREFVTAHNGLRTINWQQQVDGIGVFEALLMAHVTKRGELASVSSHFVPNPVLAADAGAPNRVALQAAPPITAAEAVARAAQNVGETVSASQVVADEQLAAGAELKQEFTAPGLLEQAHVKLVWLPMSRNNLRLCWEVIFTSRTRGEMFRHVIDVQKGDVLVRQCLTENISPATYRVYTSDSPSPLSPGHPTPLTNQPPLVPRQLLTLSALDTNASPNGWIDDGVNETRGNNVDAHLDRNNDNQPDLPRPTGVPNRVFDFTLDLTQAPTTYGDAATVQLFYWNNWVHDKLYALGFTEAAGNFQVSNFNRGGLGNDAVQADAQDGGGFNNANMATPPDGLAPRMQMFVFNGPNPDRDGDLDAEVIIHEYVHGLSNRRVGGGVGISALQSAGMGEGWSDFYAMALLSEPTDNVDGNYATGGYLTFELAGLRENYYFGIRRYPYSTDLTKNPLTFKDIDPGQAIPHVGVPMNPIFGPFNPASADEVHNQGEVWSIALWEARANLIRKYGHTAGDQLMLQLVTDGMNLGPANPNMLQARDGILLADQVNNGGVNIPELGRGFAKRGMGASATSPGSSTTRGVVEAFDLEALRIVGTSVSDTVGGNNNGGIDPGEIIRETVTFRNAGFTGLTNAVVSLTTTTPGVSVVQPTASLGTIAAGATASNAVPFVFRVDRNIACASTIDFRAVLSANGRAFTNTFTHLVGTIVITSTATNSYGALDVPRPIPDLATTRSTNSIVTVGTNYVDDINVTLRLDHTFIGDIAVTLIAPDGTPVLLSGNNGGSADGYGTGTCATGIRTIFDDEATISIGAGVPPYLSSFRPNEALSGFDGKIVDGNWVLRIADTFGGDSGTLQCWSMNVVTRQQIIVCSPFDLTSQVSAAGATLVSESFAPANGAIDIGETVTVNFALQNTGGLDTGTITASLLPANGVTLPSGAQSYGPLVAFSGPVARPFSFTAAGASGGTITAQLLVVEGTNPLGVFNYSFGLPTTITNSNPTGIVINDSGPASPYPSTISVGGLPGVITKVTVNLTKLTHTFPDDVDIVLVSPAGQKVLLMSDAGGGFGVTNLLLTFDDASANVLTDETRLNSGTYRASNYAPFESLPAPAPGGGYSNQLGAFNGFSPNGTWSLFVHDDQGGDNGSISGGWSLAISTITPVNPPGDVSVTITATNVATVGFPFAYTITARNQGSVTANGVAVTDTLPPGLAFASIAPSQGTGTNVGSTVTALFGSLSPGATATASLTVTPLAAGTVSNSVTATASQNDTNLLNNSASIVSTVVNPAPHIVGGSTAITAENLIANGAIDAGETVTVNVGLRNTGTANTTNVVATLLTTGGVSSPSGPQPYGALAYGGAEAVRTFSFTSAATSSVVTATFQLQDGAADLGTAVITFYVGFTTVVTNPVAIVIPQIGQASPYPAVINVSNLVGILSKVTVTLSNFTHSYPEDLEMLLVGPGGERMLLASDVGGGTAVSGLTFILDDAAANALPDASALASGAFRPANYDGSADTFNAPAPASGYSAQLGVFNGASPNGAWSLFIMDNTGGDAGVIANGWQLNLTTISPLNPAPDLGLSLTAAPDTVGAGSNLVVVVTVTNRGPADANNVIITNAIPANTYLVSSSASQGSVINTGGQIYASLGNLTSGSGASLTLFFAPQLGGLLTNTAGVFANESDYLPANNVRSVVVEVLFPVQAVLGSAIPQTNGIFTFTVTGQTGLQYVIEGSTNLIDWVPISTNFPAGGKITVNDSEAVILPHRFYRARQQP